MSFSIGLSTPVEGGNYHTNVEASGGWEDLRNLIHSLRDFGRYILNGFRPKMSKDFQHKYEKWIENVDNATKKCDDAFQRVKGVRAQRPHTLGEVTAYEDRLHEALKNECEARGELINSYETLAEKTDKKHRRKEYKKREFNRDTRKKLKKLNGKVTNLLESSLYSQLQDVERLRDQCLRDKAYAETTLAFKAAFEEYERECHRACEASLEWLAASKSRLEGELSRLVHMAPSAQIGIDVNWEEVRISVENSYEDVEVQQRYSRATALCKSLYETFAQHRTKALDAAATDEERCAAIAGMEEEKGKLLPLCDELYACASRLHSEVDWPEFTRGLMEDIALAQTFRERHLQMGQFGTLCRRMDEHYVIACDPKASCKARDAAMAAMEAVKRELLHVCDVLHSEDSRVEHPIDWAAAKVAIEQQVELASRIRDHYRHVDAFDALNRKIETHFKIACSAEATEKKRAVAREAMCTVSVRLLPLCDVLHKRDPRIVDVTDWRAIKASVKRHVAYAHAFGRFSRNVERCNGLQQAFVDHYKQACTPHASDEERAQAFEALDACHAELQHVLSALKTDGPKVKNPTDWGSLEGQLMRHTEDARFYSLPLEENLMELRWERQLQSDDFVHKSQLFQTKLQQLGKTAEALDYGMWWIEEIPEAVADEEILKMSYFFIRAALEEEAIYRRKMKTWELDKEAPRFFYPARGTVFENTARERDEKSAGQLTQSKPKFSVFLGIDWQRYRKALEAAMDKRPLHSAEMERLRGTLFAHALDLSVEANACYEKCAQLYPEDSFWLLMQGQFHLSAHQWSEAKCLLPALSEEEAEQLERDIAASQAAVFSLGAEMADWVVTKALPSSALKTTAALANLTKDAWLPAVTSFPRLPHAQEMQRLGTALLDPLLNLTPRRVNNAVHLAASAFRSGRNLFSLWKGGLSWQSVHLFPHAVAALNTFGSRLTSMMNRSVHPGLRALSTITQATYHDITPLFLISSHWYVLEGAAKRLALHHRPVINQMGRYSFQMATSNTHAFTVAGVAMTTLSVMTRMWVQYGHLYSSIVMEGALSLCKERQYSEAKTTLSDANKRWFIDRSSLQQFAGAIDCIEAVDTCETVEIDIALKLNDVTRAFEAIGCYSHLKLELSYYKTLAALKAQSSTVARAFAGELEGHHGFFNRIVAFCIDCAEAQKEWRKTFQFLACAIAALPREQSAILAEYHAHISLETAVREIENAVDLYERGQLGVALAELQKAAQTPFFSHTDLVVKYRHYMAVKDGRSLEVTLGALDALSAHVRTISALFWLYESLQTEKSCHLASAHKYREAGLVLNPLKSNEQLFSRTVYQLAYYLIAQGHASMKTNPLESVKEESIEIVKTLGIEGHPVIKAYVALLKHWTTALQHDQMSAQRAALESMDELASAFTRQAIPVPKELLLQRRQFKETINLLTRR